MKPLKKILIGTSLAAESDHVVATGLAIARAAGAWAELVHVATPPVLYTGMSPIAAEGQWVAMDSKATQEALGDQARRTGLTADIGTWKIEQGVPHRVLTEWAEAEGIDLIVIGTADAGRRWPALGSTADRVLRKAVCPVLVVRAGAIFPPAKVLAPVDLSPLSAAALRHGLFLLEQTGTGPSTIETLFVLNPLEREGSLQFSADQIARFADDELRRFTEAIPADGAAMPRKVRTGYPREEILAEAEEGGADLVLLGTHGRSGLERLLLGSVAADVVREARASVLVVPPTGARVTAAEEARTADWFHVSDEVPTAAL